VPFPFPLLEGFQGWNMPLPPQYSFWDSITNISGRLKTEVSDRSLRLSAIRDFLRELRAEAERDAFYARTHALERAAAELRLQEQQSRQLLPGAAVATAATSQGRGGGAAAAI
jgi:hypothetical protein